MICACLTAQGVVRGEEPATPPVAEPNIWSQLPAKQPRKWSLGGLFDRPSPSRAEAKVAEEQPPAKAPAASTVVTSPPKQEPAPQPPATTLRERSTKWLFDFSMFSRGEPGTSEKPHIEQAPKVPVVVDAVHVPAAPPRDWRIKGLFDFSLFSHSEPGAHERLQPEPAPKAPVVADAVRAPAAPPRDWRIKGLFDFSLFSPSEPGAHERLPPEPAPMPKNIIVVEQAPAHCTACPTSAGWRSMSISDLFGGSCCPSQKAPACETACSTGCGHKGLSLAHLFGNHSCGADCGRCGKGHGLFKHGPCEPTTCAYSHLLMPLEVYVRAGPAFVVGGGNLGDNLDTGWAVDVAARGFIYDAYFRSACRGDIGFFYEYHNGDGELPGGFALGHFHRYGIFAAGGKEWYWTCSAVEGLRCKVGGDVGFRYGNAHAKVVENPHVTDRLYGFFVGADAGFLLPCCGFDVMLDGRAEWGHDFFGDSLLPDDVGQVKLLISAGLRY
jgi:hypothetical protein